MKKQKIILVTKKIFNKLTLLSFLAFVFSFTYLEAGIKNPLADKGIDSLYVLIQQILENIVIPIGAVIAVFCIIYSGFLFVTAQGNTEKLTKARSAFFWAVVGGLILLGSWAIATGIENTINAISV